MNPLQRLYRTKLALLATVSTVAGIALLLLAHWSVARWLSELPVTDVGSALFTTGLIVIFFQYIGNEDAEAAGLQRLNQAVAAQAPAIRDAVIRGFAFEPEALTNVASPAVLDRIVRNCLAIQFGDKALAAEVYDDLHEQVIRAAERRYDVNVSVALAREREPVLADVPMFVATVRWEYRVVPSSPLLRFACVSDPDEYRELGADPTSTEAWYFPPVGKLDGGSEAAFQLVEVTVDGKAQRLRRASRTGSQVYTVSLGGELVAKQREVVLAYTYRVLVQQHGHLLHLDVVRPSRGLKVQCWYGDCGIRRVNVLDYIASSKPVRVSQSEPTDPTPHVDVGFDGWVFPNAGIAFVWVLDRKVD